MTVALRVKILSYALDCLLASYMLLASLTIWCARSSVSLVPVPAQGRPVGAAPGAGRAMLRIVEPTLMSLPNALGSLGCLVAGLALIQGAPFDIRYAAIGAMAVALYLAVINLSYLIEDWQRGVEIQRMACVRSLLPTCFAAPMLLSGLRLMAQYG